MSGTTDYLIVVHLPALLAAQTDVYFLKTEHWPNCRSRIV